MTTKIQFLRTNTQQARPDPNNSNIVDGTPFLNWCRNEPGLFFKLDDNTICKIGPTYIGEDEPHSYPHSAGYTEKSNGETWLDTSNSEFPVFKVFQIDKNIEIEENDPDATEKQAIRKGRWVTPRLVLSRADVNNRDDDETNGGALIYGSNGELMVNEGEDSPTAFWINLRQSEEVTKTDNSDPSNPVTTTTTTHGPYYWHCGDKKVGIGNWESEEPEANLDIKGTLRVQSLTTALTPDQGKTGMLSVFNGNLNFHNGTTWVVIGSAEQRSNDLQSDWSVTDSNESSYIKHKPRVITSDEIAKLGRIEDGAQVNVQANWEEMDPIEDSFIKGKPTVITQEERDKLAAIEDEAEVNVKSDWNQTDSSVVSYIENKPENKAGKRAPFHEVAFTGSYTALGDKPTLPDTPAHVATAKKYELNVPATSGAPTWTEATAPTSSGSGGLAEVSTDVTIDGDGTSARPLAVANPFTTDDKTKLDGITSGASRHIPTDWDATTVEKGAIANKPTASDPKEFADVAFSGDWDDLILNRPAFFPPALTGGIIELQHLHNGVVKRLLPTTLGTAGQVLRINTGATGVEYATPAAGGGGGSGPYVERYKQDITSTISNNFSNWLRTTGGGDNVLPSTVAISPSKLYKCELSADFSFRYRDFQGQDRNLVVLSTEKTITAPQFNVRDTRVNYPGTSPNQRSDNVVELIAGRELLASSSSGLTGLTFEFYIRMGYSGDPDHHSLARIQFGKVTAGGVLICTLAPWVKAQGLGTTYSNLVVTSMKVAIYELDL